MKKLILLFFIVIISCTKSYSQAEAAQLTILNGLTAAFKKAEAQQDKIKMAKLAKQIAAVEKTYETTKDIYEYYQKLLKAVETVSSLIKTVKEVEEFYEYVIEISQLYTKYGIGYSFTSLYDFDKYLNPDQQEMYAMAMKEIYENTLEEVGDMKLIITDKKDGGASASEYDRWIEILKLHENVRTLLYNMQNLVFMQQYATPLRNRYTQSNIEIKKSFYNYETYAK